MDKDVYDPVKVVKDNPDELNLSFKFALKSEKVVAVFATDANGRSAANVLSNIYLEKKHTQDTTADEASGEWLSYKIGPAYTGYTGKNSILRSSLISSQGRTNLCLFRFLRRNQHHGSLPELW